MSYMRKTQDEWLVMYDYGYGDGLEILTTCSSKREALDDRKAYVDNEGIIPIIKRHRVPINKGGVC